MIVLLCPECPDNGDNKTTLRHDTVDRNVAVCPRCLRSYVHSISAAYPTGRINRDAPYYPLVAEVDAIFGQPTRQAAARMMRRNRKKPA